LIVEPAVIALPSGLMILITWVRRARDFRAETCFSTQ